MKAPACIPLGLLLLCTLLPWALGDVKGVKTKVKPGQCPDIKFRCMMANPPVLCKCDSACPGDQKCCELACGTNCTDPVKPGECPDVKVRCMLENPPVHCSSDSKCPGDQKCCVRHCSTDCTFPVKPGQCPDIKARCMMANPPELCRSDSACPGDQKCCELACGTNCTDPVKPGQCPDIKVRCMMMNPPVHCRSDSACPGDQKCCDLACSTNCTDPVKPGLCPHITATCDMLNPPAHCRSDSACPGEQKCCQLSCSTNCTDPIHPDVHSFKGYKLKCTPNEGLACNRKYDPVCGMDGTTYSNECEMCRTTGKSNTNVCARHKGECGQKGEKLPCVDYPRNVCTMELMYHCGSNGVSYSNHCAYCNNQASDSNLSLLSVGHCYNEQDVCE